MLWCTDVVFFGSVGIFVFLQATLLEKLLMDCDELLWRGQEMYNEVLIKLWWRSGFSKMSKWAKNIMIVVAWCDCGAGDDPEALGFALHHHCPTFIIAYCQAARNLVDWDWGQYAYSV